MQSKERASITKNSLFYMFYNVINMLFPFIANIYVSHVLLPESIGEVVYAQNIVSYFSILAFLGIPTYAIREIAKIRKDRQELSRLYSELFVINLISTACFTLLYLGVVLSNAAFREKLPLFLMAGLAVPLNAINITWLFDGLEDFQFISIRNAVFKTLSLILMVVLVRGEQDLLQYALISVFGVAGNNLFNLLHSRKYVRLELRGLRLGRHIRPVLTLVLVNLAIEIYTLVDTTMLGILSTKDHVAFYGYGSKLNRILLQLTNSVTYVMLPRISVCYKEGNRTEFNRLLTKGLKVILMFSIPVIIGIQFTAVFLYRSLFGEAYAGSARVLQVLCLTLMVSPVGYLLGSRVMLVSNHEFRMTLAVSSGAVVNVLCNALLIPGFLEFGAAAASVISELVVMCVYVTFGSRVFQLENWTESLKKYLLAGLAELSVLVLCAGLLREGWLRTCLQIAGGAAGYAAVLALLREEVFGEYLSRLLKRTAG